MAESTTDGIVGRRGGRGAFGRTPSGPWSFGPFQSARHPILVGIALVLVLAAAGVAVEAATGRLGRILAGESPESVGCFWLLGDYRIATIGAIALAWALTARAYLARWTRRSIADLEPWLVAPLVGEARFDVESRSSQRWPLRVAGAAGIALVLVAAIDIAEAP